MVTYILLLMSSRQLVGNVNIFSPHVVVVVVVVIEVLLILLEPLLKFHGGFFFFSLTHMEPLTRHHKHSLVEDEDECFSFESPYAV